MWMDLDDSVLSSTGIEVELRKGKTDILLMRDIGDVRKECI